ncbi:ImmA/IrrE family metallo-endopeptidase [Henriciella mobilis]|uniref:helix-turn-helix domain-containing protein n=1 Tax=Henriciella mobilis TaxID=2305467 RepID=UPI000E670134|nr:XRE family transcriptional regulator [Henriciella mobilis]RIJ15266.1 ImmA/IrrE family metallo-endopeptidase [Henriciella mobilis]RIJ18730.1 ImmA/IrrE family metallo-endopeptidase [Henriciella mobilis]
MGTAKSNIIKFPGAALDKQAGRFLFPERITEARVACRMTQTELARRVGVQRQSISYFENGDRNPDPETLKAIADALNQPLRYFSTSSPQTFGKRSANFFRKHGPDTKRRNAASDQYASWLAQTAFAFDRFVSFQTVSLPRFEPSGQHNDPNRYTAEELESLAEETRRALGIGLGPISNTVRLVEAHGVFVARLMMTNENVSAFSFWSGDRPFIFLASDKESAVRARFDICHELGHLVLHRWITQDEIEDKVRLKEIEQEADYFAGAFLLPRNSFPNEVYSPRLSAFVELKKRWKVSIQAMIFRCKNLGLFDEDQCVNLYKQISYKKWRTSEPLDIGPNSIPFEEPLLLRRISELVFEKDPLNRDELLNHLGLSPNVVETLLALPAGTLEPTHDQEPDIQLK